MCNNSLRATILLFQPNIHPGLILFAPPQHILTQKNIEKPGIFLSGCNAGPDQSFLITFSQHPPGDFTQAHLVGSSASDPALPSQPGTLPCWCSWEPAGYGALHLHSSYPPPFAPRKRKIEM